MRKKTTHVLKQGEDASGQLFDHLRTLCGYKCDRPLAEDFFKMHRGSISKIRNGVQPVTDSMILTVVEKTKMTPKQVRGLIAKPRFKKQPYEVVE